MASATWRIGLPGDGGFTEHGGHLVLAHVVDRGGNLRGGRLLLGVDRPNVLFLQASVCRQVEKAPSQVTSARWFPGRGGDFLDELVTHALQLLLVGFTAGLVVGGVALGRGR